VWWCVRTTKRTGSLVRSWRAASRSRACAGATKGSTTRTAPPPYTARAFAPKLVRIESPPRVKASTRSATGVRERREPSLELVAGQKLVGLHVAGPRPGHDVGGRTGAGGVLFHPVVSSQSRRNCLSNEGGEPPGFQLPFGQNREESGVSASSIQTTFPRSSSRTRTSCRRGGSPSTRRSRRPGGRSGASGHGGAPRGACDGARHRGKGDVLVVPDSAFVAGVKIGSGSLSASLSPGGSRWPQTSELVR